MSLDNCPAPVQATLADWHEMVRKGDMSDLPRILHPDVVFRSPVAHTHYQGAAALHMAVTAAMGVFENFAYHREMASADGLDVVLEFSAEVDGKALKGVDLIRFTPDGQFAEFEVMVRPMSGLQALGARMAAAVGEALKAAG